MVDLELKDPRCSFFVDMKDWRGENKRDEVESVEREGVHVRFDAVLSGLRL